MRALFYFALLAALIIAAIFYYGNGKPAPTDAANQPTKNSFDSLTGLLQGEMSKIPATLDLPRQVPSHAYQIKSRVSPYLDQHAEYQVLSKACDLIIYADQEHSVRQAQAKLEMAGAGDDSRRAAIHTQAQTRWTDYRRSTDAEVKRLLTSLNGKSL